MEGSTRRTEREREREGGRDTDSDADTEPDIDESFIDPDLRLRTVRTAASTIAESIRSEARIEKRRKGLRRTLKGTTKGHWKLSLKKKSVIQEGESTSLEDDTFTVQSQSRHQRSSSMGASISQMLPDNPSPEPKPGPKIGRRRNIYVNLPLPINELNTKGEPIVHFTRNKVRTTSKSILAFFYYSNPLLKQNTPYSRSYLKISSSNSVGSQISTSSSSLSSKYGPSLAQQEQASHGSHSLSF
jgi:hypothetical protein